MTPRNVTMSFSVFRLKLIEEALKKSLRLFPHQQRNQIKGAIRQINARIEKYEQVSDEQKMDF